MLATINGRGRRAIEQNGKVNFARDVDRFRDEHLVDDAPGGAGLMRDQRLAEHFAGDVARFVRRFDQVDAAFESVRERPLAAAAGMNLRLHHEVGRRELARDLLRFRRRGGDLSAGRRHAEFLQTVPWPDIRECSSGERAHCISSRSRRRQRIFCAIATNELALSARTSFSRRLVFSKSKWRFHNNL